jgi:REP element-mobilizing transposase RayT
MSVTLGGEAKSIIGGPACVPPFHRNKSRIWICVITQNIFVWSMSPFFDDEAEFDVHRRNLPHRTQSAVTYFVTYHLADSVPAKKLAQFKAERNLWLEMNPPPHSENQIQEYRRNFSQRIHEWLDAGYGSCVLARPTIFRMVENALKFFNGQRYLLGEHIVMPNHIHALVTPLGNHQLNDILHSWKSYSAKQINKMTNSRGAVWHPESFDHIIRSPAQLARIEQYIRDNPKSLPLSQFTDV